MRSIGLWCLARVKQFWEFLRQPTIPLWLTLVLTGIGTYWIAPQINQQFQRESLKREYISGSLDALNTNTIELTMAANAVAMANGSPETFELANNKIVEIQHKLVRLAIVFPQAADAVVSSQTALSMLQFEIGRQPIREENVLTALREFSSRSLEMYQMVVEQAGLV